MPNASGPKKLRCGRLTFSAAPPPSPSFLGGARREFFLVYSGALPYFFLRIWTSLYAGYFS